MGNMGCGSSKDGKAGVPVPFQQPQNDMVSKARASFNALDQNRDGFIDIKEMEAWTKHLPPATRIAFFKSLDDDGNGLIDFQEFQKRFFPLTDLNPQPAQTQSFSWDGLWLMEWPGPYVACSIEEGHFRVNGRSVRLETDEAPAFFRWDGVQELKRQTPNLLTWTGKTGMSAGRTFTWVRVPSCPLKCGHKMDLSREKREFSCQSCTEAKNKEWFWQCRCCVAQEPCLCHNCAAVPREPPVLGVSVAYLLDIFPEVVQHYLHRNTNSNGAHLENPNFHELANRLAIGSDGLGYGKECPRDGKPNCSIVDALDEHHKGNVTHFLSWCWVYKVNDFLSALRGWAKREKIVKNETYLWICFFCNNQYRMLQNTSWTGADELKSVFESHLVQAGHMLILMDSFLQPAYITRAWCIFESFVCLKNRLPMTIILPEQEEMSFKKIMDTSGGPRRLQQVMEDLDVRYAEASQKSDEDMIKLLILRSTGFDAVNEAVKEGLLDQLLKFFRQYMATGQKVKH